MCTQTLKSIRRLTDMAPGAAGSVAKLKLEAAEENRLAELGLRRGASVRILQGTTNESVLLAVGDGRIGVNYGVAQKIYVFS